MPKVKKKLVGVVTASKRSYDQFISEQDKLTKSENEFVYVCSYRMLRGRIFDKFEKVSPHVPTSDLSTADLEDHLKANQ